MLKSSDFCFTLMLPTCYHSCSKVQNDAMNSLQVTTDKTRISVYLEPSLKEDLERLAKLRKRSMSNLIEVLCESEIDRAKESGEMK